VEYTGGEGPAYYIPGKFDFVEYSTIVASNYLKRKQSME
jgi:hypothetical protein